jgi:hypothetical protein
MGLAHLIHRIAGIRKRAWYNHLESRRDWVLIPPPAPGQNLPSLLRVLSRPPTTIPSCRQVFDPAGSVDPQLLVERRTDGPGGPTLHLTAALHRVAHPPSISRLHTVQDAKLPGEGDRPRRPIAAANTDGLRQRTQFDPRRTPDHRVPIQPAPRPIDTRAPCRQVQQPIPQIHRRAFRRLPREHAARAAEGTGGMPDQRVIGLSHPYRPRLVFNTEAAICACTVVVPFPNSAVPTISSYPPSRCPERNDRAAQRRPSYPRLGTFRLTVTFFRWVKLSSIPSSENSRPMPLCLYPP